MATLKGSFLVVRQDLNKENPKATPFLTLVDLSNGEKLSVSSPVMLEDKALHTPVELDLIDFGVYRTRAGGFYCRVSNIVATLPKK